MFQPHFCPFADCRADRAPRERSGSRRFFVRKGYYHPRCRSHPVPRFKCKSCGRGFSRQTFRADYRDHRPDRNVAVFLALATGIGLRQTARNVGMSRRCTELKFRKIARHLRNLNLNLRGPLPEDATLQFDELETFEGRRNTRPLTLPIVIDRTTRFVIWAESAPIKPRGTMTKKRLRAIAADERRFGPRQDRSRPSVRRTLARAARLVRHLGKVVLQTDEKTTYPGIARSVFGKDRLCHQRTNSKLPRTTWNPLFPINHTEAMARDSIGRLRRRSWLASKRGRYLDLAMQMWMAYRNYVRRRFNFDSESPAEMLGFVDRRLSPQELLSWRQIWGHLSPHPLAPGGASIAQRAAAAG